MDGRWACAWFAAFACGCGRTPVYGDHESTGTDEPRDCVIDLDSHTQDCDEDDIPDGDDPFPSDATRPGRARDDVIYAHDATRLFVIDPDDDAAPQPFADFELVGGDGPVTDIAIDHHGVFYAITQSQLYACDPEVARCWALGEIVADSLAFLPVGVLDDDDSTLVTLPGNTWTRVDLRGPEFSTTVLGSVASAYTPTGDAVYDGNDLTWFPTGTMNTAFLVSILPGNGASDLTVLAWFANFRVTGLAAFDGRVWAFDEIGSVFNYDYDTNALEIRLPASDGFAGAAAHLESR